MSFDDLLDKAQRALEEDDSCTALPLLQEALKLQQTPEAWLLLAEAQLDENQLAQAKKSLTAGLKLNSEHIDLLYFSADLSLEEEKVNAALQTYARIIELDSQQTDARVYKALLEMDEDRLDAAEKTCRTALEKEPDSVLALNALGDICCASGQNQQALESYLLAVGIDPEEPQTHLNLADLYYEMEKLPEAEEACCKALQLDAGLALAYLTLGYIYMDLDRAEDAIENFQQFLKLENSSSAKQIRDEVKAAIEGLK